MTLETTVTGNIKQPGLFRRAFTLVESLVVVSVLSLLLAITVPTFVRAKELGRRTYCANNMHTISVGQELYGSENREALPMKSQSPISGSGIWNGNNPFNYGILVPTKTSQGYGVSAKAFYCPSAAQYTIDRETTGAQNFDEPGKICITSIWQRGKNQTKEGGLGDGIPMNRITMANHILLADYQTKEAIAVGDWKVWTHKDNVNTLYCGGTVKSYSAQGNEPHVDMRFVDMLGGDKDGQDGAFTLLEKAGNN